MVAIPARDEAERIGPCLLALNEQTRLPDGVVLMLNSCTDATETIARGMKPTLRFPLDLIVEDLPPSQSGAGFARRRAMAAAASQAGPSGLLLTTDADSVAPPDWVDRNLSAMARGADAVCGRAIIDPVEATFIPPHLHADDALECRLIALLDELAWELDPELHDPLPRHAEASGASLAVTAEAFHRVGGIPPVASGEDRAFVRNLWMIDARVRHDPAIQVVVSGRIEGRAVDGMADTIRRRIEKQDEFTDEMVEPATDAYRRYDLRRRVRRAWSGKKDSRLADDLGLAATMATMTLAARYFGQVWAKLEATSSVLARRRVRFTDLSAEIDAAEMLLQLVSVSETLAAD